MKCFIAFFYFFISFFGFSQQTEYVDFKKAKAEIAFGDLKKKEVSGSITYEFKILKDTDSIYFDANNFQNISSTLDGTFMDSLYNGKQLIVKYPFKPNTTHKLDITFKTSPKKAMYFIDWDTSTALSVTNEVNVTSSDSLKMNRIEKNSWTQSVQIWTQGQGKYTSNWLPSVDDMNEKIEFDLSITFDNEYEVIANGKLTNKQINDSTITWHYNMQQPMSSYLVALAIGKYDKKVEYSDNGIPLEMYYYPEDSLKIEPTYRYTKQIFDFLEEEIGVPYPWQNYKQVPVKDFLYAGMENTSATIFADSFVIDSIAFVDKNYVNVNAHELAHQWFGNLVTETSGKHHWLQEGFATYYALLAERNIFGDDYYYWRLYEYAQELWGQEKAGLSTSLLDPQSSSATFYKKGAWVLHILREKVGNKAFSKAVKAYLEKHQFKNVETKDFINEVEKASGKDLREFMARWLEDKTLFYDEMIKNLKLNSSSINQHFLYDCNETPQLCKTILLRRDNSIYKEKIIEALGSTHITKSTFLIDDIKVRQAIAQTLSQVPLELKSDYETLLNDESYITMEVALFNLWRNFAEDREKYLNKTKGIQGFNDKNVRILWLTLALLTDDYEIENRPKYFDELTDYTSSKYSFEVRQNAFQYLTQIQACNDVCKENLKQATTHHSWQFTKFAKNLLEVINKSKD
ncbi:M1 family metallopeptidase [Litoribaculum gwangyangense]|uniref:Aminopeptidase N n=1 Tax=Litoribaculum gwangyangense TaxID=1130722 RepID=A0ABP9CE21_9FLAO